MTSPVAYRRMTATRDEILAHLQACDAQYLPSLSSRVDLAAYAGKLSQHATTFEAWDGPLLAGLVAAYLNDQRGRGGFVTSVSVVPGHARTGIASTLMDTCLAEARLLRMQELALEVSRASPQAIGLYRKLGFVESGGDTNFLSMRLPLQDPSTNEQRS
jgi:ribosomal protein S18 acetylase RimI-like enzyme